MTSELAEPFDIALRSFAQRLGLLEECGLVRSRKDGRVRTYELVPRPLEAAERWITRQRVAWAKRLDQLDRHLAAMTKETP